MKLVSVNVSLPKTVVHEGRAVSTGIYKEPVIDRVMVHKLHLDGDGQADLSVHGGVHKAVYVYDLDSYRYWRRELDRDDLNYGHFGENLTVEGMPDDQIHIGDIFRVGSALLEVTQPRTPCFKLEMKMGLPGFSRQFLISGRLGFYFRVLEEWVKGRDYDSTGHVTVDLLKELLPDNNMSFRLCGPPSFMNSIMKDLRDWGVPGNRIHFELFGPASLLQEGVRPKRKRPRKKLVSGEESFEVVFLQSGITAKWDAEYANLLDFAEDKGVLPDFSYRSGICHTCMYELLEGEVEYAFEPLDPPYPGQVLLCCTRPKSNLVIDV
jgi:MOSC domain-containing protein YiiM/ferredoxin